MVPKSGDGAQVRNILQAAVELQVFCLGQSWRFCFIGGVAVQRWGEPRFTHDVDLTLLTGFGNEKSFVERLLAQFAAREPNEREFAIERRVVLLNSSTGVPIDIALGAFDFEERSIQRASLWKARSHLQPLLICSAEDLIVHKAFAARDIDWFDVARIVMRQGRKLNVDQIWSELRPLVALKEEPEILTKLQKIFDDQLRD